MTIGKGAKSDKGVDQGISTREHCTNYIIIYNNIIFNVKCPCFIHAVLVIVLT